MNRPEWCSGNEVSYRRSGPGFNRHQLHQSHFLSQLYERIPQLARCVLRARGLILPASLTKFSPLFLKVCFVISTKLS